MKKLKAASGQPKYDPWERQSVYPITYLFPANIHRSNFPTAALHHHG